MSRSPERLPVAAVLIDLGGAVALVESGCRPACAACCIAPSISTPMPGLPQGKPAGMACPHLDQQLRCRLFGQPERPTVCQRLRPQPEMCGADREQALGYLQELERATAVGLRGEG